MQDRETTERMRAAIETNLRQAIETERGECIAVDDETGEEWGHKWRGGETRVYVEGEEEGVEYVLGVQVVLLAVERE
jgi:hypothetical protein